MSRRSVLWPAAAPRVCTRAILRVAALAVFSWVAEAGGMVATPGDWKKLSIEELMEIEVTSVSRSPVALADAPSALQVITHQDVRRSGATSLPEALRLANNLNVAQKNAHGWGVSARGFNTELANKLLVMIDGRTVYTPLFSGVRWDVQDVLLEDLERIEVISGPGGAMWGANAVNGVINITSKHARDTQGFYAEGGGGNQLEGFAAARYGGLLAPNVAFRIYGKHTDRAGSALATGVRAADDARLSQGGFRIDADTPADGAVTVQGDYYRGWTGIPAAGDAKVAGGNLLTRWSQVLAGGSDLQLQLYFDRAFLRQPAAASVFGPAGRFTDDLTTYDLDFQHRLDSEPRGTFTWGLGYRRMQDKSRAAPTLGFLPAQQRQELFSGFVQQQYPFGRASLLTAGTKLEHTHYTGFEVEPSLRWQTTLTPDHMVWTAVSRAVRTPSRIDRDLRQPSAGRTILSGGADFDSETVVAYEAGYRAQLGPRLIGAVAAFYNDYREIRSLNVTPVTFLPLYFANDVEGTTHGVELTAQYDLTDWWRLRAGYTYLKSDLRVRAGGRDLNNALNEMSDPEHQASLGSSVDLPRGIEFDGQLRWVDTLENNRNGRVGTVPGYVELNLRVGLHVSDRVEISVVGQNLLDAQHPEFGVPVPTRVEIRRSVFAKVAWRY